MAKYLIEYDDYKGKQTRRVVRADDEAAALSVVLDTEDDVLDARFVTRFTVQRLLSMPKSKSS